MPTLTRGDFETYFETSGAGEPLLLISGLSASHLVWRGLVPFLERTLRVITFDNRGAGQSSVPDAPYSIDQMAADTLALMDHLNIASANVVGWSMGGLVAQTLAVKYPQRVNRLVLLSSLLAPDAMVRNAVHNLINMRRSDMGHEQVTRHVAWLVFSQAFAADEAAYEAVIQSIVKSPNVQPLHGLVRQAEALLAHVPPAGIDELPMPVSILVGEEDRLIPRYHSEQLHRTIPQSRLRVLPGAHMGASEHPELYAKGILRHLHGTDDA
jgi:pimeloyl-ACP methyl ester carboxylesterase